MSYKRCCKTSYSRFIATSPIHLTHKLKMTQQQVLESIKEHVSYAKQYFDVVQFSPEDATRTDTDFLIKCVQMAVDCGATIINIPDTVGYSYPNEYGRIFKTLIENINSKQDITYSAHCHDDLGMAVANSLAAIENGAKRIEGTVNGIGERAGNTAIEELALALYVRKDHYGNETRLKLSETKILLILYLAMLVYAFLEIKPLLVKMLLVMSLAFTKMVF